MTANTSNEKLKAWLQLLRVPNLFTVPGDPLAGLCLAAVSLGTGFSVSCAALVAVLLVSLLSYSSGLLQNDYFDLEEDRENRPSRPLPSNKAKPGTVIVVAVLFVVAALTLAFSLGYSTLVPAIALTITVTAYDYRGKRIPVIGPVLMGLCRGLDILLGASLFGWAGLSAPAVLISALLITVYIAFVTHIAARETEGYRAGSIRWAPTLTLVVWFAALYLIICPATAYALVVSIALSIAAIAWTLYCGNFLKTDAPPAVIQQTIGRFIRGLLLIQATCASFVGWPGFIIVLILLVAWPVSQRIGRWFYAS